MEVLSGILSALFLSFVLFIFFMLFLILPCAKIIKQYEKGVILRWSKYQHLRRMLAENPPKKANPAPRTPALGGIRTRGARAWPPFKGDLMRQALGYRHIATGAALLMCLAVTGCGASTPPASPSTAPSGSATTPAVSAPSTPAASATTSAVALDSMTVVTRAEAAAALGQPVRAAVRGKATVEGGVAAVFYGPSVPVGTNPDVPVANSVRVVLVTGPSAKSFFDDYRTKVPAKAEPGFGDQAYYDGSASLSVLKGDEYLRIAVVGPRGISLAAEKKLARDALARM